MANYKKGTETKTALYNSAKKFFYTKGYHETTIKEMVVDAESNPGLFVYYFEGKESVAMGIFREFADAITLALKDILEPLKDAGKDLLVDMVEYRAYFECINANPEIIRFYNGISELGSFPKLVIGWMDFFTHKRYEDGLKYETNPMICDKTYFDAVASLTAGMQIQFFRDIIQKNIDIPYEDAIDMFLTECYRFLVPDKNQVQENVRNSRKVTEGLKFEVSEYFKVTVTEKNKK
ncbi:TetR/AcrR family transcriptional regulator [Eubacterium sp. 1001713B170207_170306_E7]|uniref:TetR/AcrR family transcriptional regulator n=1 Tax=Eubacterium sp. 1001713B170207_170306_E7 TaxID=2787097 RepID=UPI001898CCEB|nr:TetR/AcrR family transcriptional regulator [Eubacterium sp. 1001713B170207_170306_E7]